MSGTTSTLNTPSSLTPASEISKSTSSFTSSESLLPQSGSSKISNPPSRYPPGIQDIISRRSSRRQQDARLPDAKLEDSNSRHPPYTKTSQSRHHGAKPKDKHPGYGDDCPLELKTWKWSLKDNIDYSKDQEDVEPLSPTTLPTGEAITRSSRQIAILDLEDLIADVNRIDCGMHQVLSIYFTRFSIKIELPSYWMLDRRMVRLKEKLATFLTGFCGCDETAPEGSNQVDTIELSILEFREKLTQVIARGFFILECWTDTSSIIEKATEPLQPSNVTQMSALANIPHPPASPWSAGRKIELAQQAYMRHKDKNPPSEGQCGTSREMDLKLRGIRGKDVELIGSEKLEKKLEIRKTSGRISELSSMVKDLIRRIPVSQV